VTEPLLRLLRDAAGGRPPAPDGVVELLAAAGRHLTPLGEPLFAQVATGNAASLRAVQAAGFRPIGAEVLFHRGG
jgi:hypothetical protein